MFAALAAEDGADAGDALAFRAFGLLPLLVLFVFPARRAMTQRVVRPLLAMAALSSFNVAAYFIAVGRMSPAFVALLIYAYPALVIAGAAALGWRRLDALTALALALVLGGVILTLGTPDGDLDPAAVALSLIAAFGCAAYILLAQRALGDTDPVTTVGFAGGLSSVVILIAVLIRGFDPPSNGSALLNLVLLAVVSTAAAHILVMIGIRTLGSVWSALASCLEVLTTAIASVLMLGTAFEPPAIAGGALLLLGGVAAPILAVRAGTVPEETISATTVAHSRYLPSR